MSTCEVLPLLRADDPLILQVVLVAEDHQRREDPLVLRIPQSPQTFYSLLHILQAGPGVRILRNIGVQARQGLDLLVSDGVDK